MTYKRCLTQWMCIWIHHHANITVSCVCQIWEVGKNPVSLLGYKQHHLTVVEALNQYGRVPTSTDDIQTLFDNLHMQWMGIWSHHHAVTATCVGPELERQLKPVTLLGHEQQYLTVAEALNQHGRMIPTSTDDI